ncbi:MAG: thioredoxin fold domain-containing protein [Pseudohongiellaceae bacterium]
MAKLSALIAGMLLLANISAAQNVSDPDQVAGIREMLTRTQPNMTILDISPSPVAGLYEISVQNGQVLYASADGQFFLHGDLYQATSEGLVNLGEQKRNVWRADKIAALDESEMIVYEADGERKAVLTVFTDVDCPYCRQLHAEVPQLNAMGIAVRYLAYPRTGLDTETYHRMVSTWCAEDAKSMMTSAKRGGGIPEASCDNPVASHYQLGREVGVTGTPALVMEDGAMVPGYVPAQTLGPYLLGETPAQ